MSYLGPLRLHFAGTFQASVSTLNNNTQNWDDDNWGAGRKITDIRFDPTGDASWRLIGCAVTSALMGDGSAAGADDPVLKCTVADSATRVAGKLVDLDPQQQMVSTIFGLEVRIAAADGTTLVGGRFRPAAFTDAWQRWTAGSNDPAYGACYQSVLTDLQWEDAAAGSPFLSALRAATQDGMLSIKFNVDGYQTDSTDLDYTRGRVVGTIGPYAAGEPLMTMFGRRFLREPSAFVADLNSAWAVVDEEAGKVLLDLGNTLPTQSRAGLMIDQGPLAVSAGAVSLGPVGGYTTADWYADTAGIVALPPDRVLGREELEALASTPIAIVAQGTGATLEESPQGLYARPDEYVYRLDPGQSAQARVVAMSYGKPLAGAEVRLTFDQQVLAPIPGDPATGTPEDALTFPATVTTGDDGFAPFTLEAGDPKNPRVYVDGQVYAVRPALAAAGVAYPASPWDFVSVHVYDAFDVQDPEWYAHLQPVFEQYANLYPVMRRILDLSSYEAVCANRASLLMAFGLDFDDPNYMPVTRDLSAGKLAAIQAWLAKDPPPLGAPVAMGTASRVAPGDEPQPAGGGGKALSAAVTGEAGR